MPVPSQLTTSGRGSLSIEAEHTTMDEQEHRRKVEAVFRKHDADASGTIDGSELVTALRALNALPDGSPEAQRKFVDDLLARVEPDDDAASSLTLSRVSKAVRPRSGARCVPRRGHGRKRECHGRRGRRYAAAPRRARSIARGREEVHCACRHVRRWHHRSRGIRKSFRIRAAGLAASRGRDDALGGPRSAATNAAVEHAVGSRRSQSRAFERGRL